ncbi:signal peptide peptidase SppA [Treponema parvum]|uniref:signal peptide peptidase SppA n=1 Tax=Treponema parvum TaxID=138851 RepID=UPI001AEC3AF1|nr:signal peptide peptidase SppA [Treponema parvum]QTQ15662.1 signal peptide peptidase SppA [Treponema parvum]
MLYKSNTDKENKDSEGFTKKRRRLSKGYIVLIVLIIVAAAAGIYPLFFAHANSLKTSDTVNSTDRKSFDVSPSDKLNKITDIKKLFEKRFNINELKKSDYIAVVYIEGVIEDKNKTYNQSELLDVISDLEYDERNKAILLFINSPGGGVYKSDEVYTALERYKTTGKKVHAYMGELAASGGYYVACAASHISANRNTLTGSIGVIAGQSLDATGLLQKLGIKAKTITAGKNKNMMNFDEPLSQEQLSIMQSVADDAYVQFTNIVANSRNMSQKRIQTLADGRIYTARQALENGLIDSICSVEEAQKKLEEELKMPMIDKRTFRFERRPSVYDYFTDIETAVKIFSVFANTGSIDAALKQASRMSYPAYYYSR